MDVAEGDLVRQVLAVLVVFGLLGVVVWKLRGRALPGRSNGPHLESMGRLALTPQHAIHLVRIDGQDLVVATHPHGCSVLSQKADV